MYLYVCLMDGVSQSKEANPTNPTNQTISSLQIAGLKQKEINIKTTIDGTEIPFPTHLGCIKNPAKNGINYLSLNWWVDPGFLPTINSMPPIPHFQVQSSNESTTEVWSIDDLVGIFRGEKKPIPRFSMYGNIIPIQTWFFRVVKLWTCFFNVHHENWGKIMNNWRACFFSNRLKRTN